MTVTLKARPAFVERPRTDNEWQTAETEWEEELSNRQANAIRANIRSTAASRGDQSIAQLTETIVDEICQIGLLQITSDSHLSAIGLQLLKQEPGIQCMEITDLVLNEAIYPFKAGLNAAYFPSVGSLVITKLWHLGVRGVGRTCDEALQDASKTFHSLFKNLNSQTPSGHANRRRLKNVLYLLHEKRHTQWRMLYDNSISIEDRLKGLDELTLPSDGLGERFVANSICCDTTDPKWKDALVLFAEHLQFEDSSIRKKLTWALIRIAEVHAFANPLGREDVTFAAIRLAASMIDASSLDAFKSLLSPPSSFDTRLAMLLALRRVLEAEVTAPKAPAVADRCFQLAEKYLDRDLMTPGFDGAIGIAATMALAAFDDDRTLDCIEQALSAGVNWHSSEVLKELKDLYQSLQQIGAHPNRLKNLNNAIVRLQSSLDANHDR